MKQYGLLGQENYARLQTESIQVTRKLNNLRDSRTNMYHSFFSPYPSIATSSKLPTLCCVLVISILLFYCSTSSLLPPHTALFFNWKRSTGCPQQLSAVIYGQNETINRTNYRFIFLKKLVCSIFHMKLGFCNKNIQEIFIVSHIIRKKSVPQRTS